MSEREQLVYEALQREAAALWRSADEIITTVRRVDPTHERVLDEPYKCADVPDVAVRLVQLAAQQCQTALGTLRCAERLVHPARAMRVAVVALAHAAPHCSEYHDGASSGDCQTDGHYECRTCIHRDPDPDGDWNTAHRGAL